MDFSDPANLIIAGAYYIITAGLCLFSIFSVYILVRFGRNTLLSLLISLMYSFFFLKILTDSYKTLQGL